jgi:hypothetical protein
LLIQSNSSGVQALLVQTTEQLAGRKSTADFINKLKIVEEELDESIYFLELITEIEPSLKESSLPLIKEGNELLSIIVASINTSLKRKAIKQSKIQNLQSKIYN